uniref:Uncharacterized protein n=1 Tax=Arundo donax TaxID=35708 RepID=A0A0A9DE94_ARUDO
MLLVSIQSGLATKACLSSSAPQGHNSAIPLRWRFSSKGKGLLIAEQPLVTTSQEAQGSTTLPVCHQ